MSIGTDREDIRLVEDDRRRERDPLPNHRREYRRDDRSRSDEICRDYQRTAGRCPRGDSCLYIHKEPTGELPPPRPRRESCRDFLNTGRCPRGSRCGFAHFVGEKEVCRDFNRGNCPRGTECNYAHVLIDGDRSPRRHLETDTDPRAYPPRKRPRYDYPTSPRTISASEYEHYLALKSEVAGLREDNRYLRDEIRALRVQLNKETRRPERRY